MDDLVRALIAAAGVAVTPVPASAGPAPLRVTSCRLVIEHHGPRGPVQQNVIVSFANDRDSPADEARFTIANVDGVTKAFTARGSFTKGVLIADRILPAEAVRDDHVQAPIGSSNCAVTYVHFIDGTSWPAPP